MAIDLRSRVESVVLLEPGAPATGPKVQEGVVRQVARRHFLAGFPGSNVE